MGLIKKHYKKIVSYGLIILGIILSAIIFKVHPIKQISQELYDYQTSPILSSIDFPFYQNITITKDDPVFIELRFEDDSINQYQYTISLSHNQETIFEHFYDNEVSNIIKIPTVEANLKKDDEVVLKIECSKTCKEAKINLYDIDGEKRPKILIAHYRQDLGLYWYGVFCATIGLTLLPLSKEKK